MANTFPVTKNNYPTGVNSPTLFSMGHVDVHNALETKVGVDNSTDANSLDYKLTNTSSVDPGHKHTLSTGATDLSKAASTDVDTGTNDTKFVTAKAIADSHNVPSVTPSTSGNLMTSNGTDWVSSAPPVSVSVTTKGDLQTYSTTPARLPVGNNGQALVADSTTSTGLRWGTAGASALEVQVFS